MNYKALAHVLKYSSPASPEDFQRVLDENPSDWVTRLVYADWLKEHDMKDEEEFQRSMADWHKDGKMEVGQHPTHPHAVDLYKSGSYPTGVISSFMPHKSHISGTSYFPMPHNHPNVGVGDYPRYEANEIPIMESSNRISAKLRWSTYKDMENAFRKNFITHKKMQRGE